MIQFRGLGSRTALTAASLLALGLPAFGAKEPKVTICHRAGSSYNAITVNGNAVAAHLSHGDGVPFGDISGSPGFVFDETCGAVTWDYAVNVPPDLSATDPSSPGNLYAGSGIPAVNFGTARNEAAGIELGMMVLYRQGPTIPSTDTYADGVLEFNVASGPQSVANGSAANVPNRAAWNFTFSVATGLNGATTSLADYTFELLYDVDPGPGTTYRTLTLESENTPQSAGQSGFQWRDLELNLVPIADDEGTANVTQNSQNYAFLHFSSFPANTYSVSGFVGPARFDIILQAKDGQQVIARNHVAVNVSAP